MYEYDTSHQPSLHYIWQIRMTFCVQTRSRGGGLYLLTAGYRYWSGIVSGEIIVTDHCTVVLVDKTIILKSEKCIIIHYMNWTIII